MICLGVVCINVCLHAYAVFSPRLLSCFAALLHLNAKPPSILFARGEKPIQHLDLKHIMLKKLTRSFLLHLFCLVFHSILESVHGFLHHFNSSRVPQVVWKMGALSFFTSFAPFGGVHIYETQLQICGGKLILRVALQCQCALWTYCNSYNCCCGALRRKFPPPQIPSVEFIWGWRLGGVWRQSRLHVKK